MTHKWRERYGNSTKSCHRQYEFCATISSSCNFFAAGQQRENTVTAVFVRSPGNRKEIGKSTVSTDRPDTVGFRARFPAEQSSKLPELEISASFQTADARRADIVGRRGAGRPFSYRPASEAFGSVGVFRTVGPSVRVVGGRIRGVRKVSGTGRERQMVLIIIVIIIIIIMIITIVIPKFGPVRFVNRLTAAAAAGRPLQPVFRGEIVGTGNRCVGYYNCIAAAAAAAACGPCRSIALPFTRGSPCSGLGLPPGQC